MDKKGQMKKKGMILLYTILLCNLTHIFSKHAFNIKIQPRINRSKFHWQKLENENKC